MTPTEQGRFCAHCQRSVIDFTGYSDAALYEFFSKHTGHVCGRMLATQLNREINIPPQPHSRLYRLFIGFGLTLIFTQVPSAHARPPLPVAVDNAFYMPESDTAVDDSIQLRILVLDEKKEPMIGAVVQLLNGQVVISGSISDIDGNVILKLPDPIDRSHVFIKIVYQSYKTEVVSLSHQNTSKLLIVQMKLEGKACFTGLINVQYKIPLIDPFEPEKRSKTSEEIEKLPVR